ncbi:uncharacterized protein Fot_55780 [Forsythia ovata]|uniref:Cardiolipin synthase N-terminal domain-containing protein n=1 Tax=Forsythia ovata TaxID=205694 RepID=A0ABD1P4M7_9LAMI
MIASSSFTSCNFSFLPIRNHSCSRKSQLSSLNYSSNKPRSSIISLVNVINPNDIERATKYSAFLNNYDEKKKKKKGLPQICHNAFYVRTSQDPVLVPLKENGGRSGGSGGDGGGGGGDGEERDWTSSFLLFAFWAGVMYYVFFLTPNQTPSIDLYFLGKLLNLKGDDGFQMNEVIVALWYIMGLWPLVYSMLLLPTGRSSKGKIPVWPFLVLSCFGGAYGLIPYFVLWRPPAPPVEETELRRWPLNFLESKLTAGITMAAGLAIIIYAGLSSVDVWKEYFQYFRGSKFIHLTSIDFSLLSAFAPFWVYNDMTARKWEGKGYWLLPLSLIPFLGPSLYLLLRPSLSAAPVSRSPTLLDDK